MSVWTLSRVADVLEVVGFVGSIVGFVLAIRAARKAKTAADQAKTAAEQAEAAAKDAKTRLLTFDAVSTLASVIVTMQEISRLQREKQWGGLPPTYSTARRSLGR